MMIYPLRHHSYDGVTKVDCHRLYVSAALQEYTRANEECHCYTRYTLSVESVERIVMVAKRLARVRSQI